MSAVISCGALTYTHPDGSVALDGLDMLVPAGRSGLVGVNGSGKSTLLKLIAGELRPTSGMVHASGEIGYLPQDLTIRADQSVPDLLGLTPVLAAIEAIENGSTDQTDFDTVGDDWDLAERVRAELDRLGLPAAVLDRSLGELSGGEVIRLGLARLLLRRPDVLLLDEPTNNLDGESRRHLYDVVSAWQRTLLVVSHDRELLEHVERIGDLRDGGVTWYGGGYSDYAAAVAAEQEAAAQAISTAKAEVRRERRDLAEAERVIAQRRRYGAKMQANKREPKIVMGLRKRAAQESAAALKQTQTDRLDKARENLGEAQTRLRADRSIRIDLPGTEVPAGRVVLTTEQLVLRHGVPAHLDLRGPQRVGLVGPNGSGKTTLLHTIAGRIPAAEGSATVHVPLGLLPQRLDLLDDSLSVADNVARVLHTPTSMPSGPGWRDSCSAAMQPTNWSGRSPVVNGSGRHWPPCCWRTPLHSCCCSTNPPTTWTSPPTTRWSPRLPSIGARCSLPAMTWAFWRTSGPRRWTGDPIR